MHKKLDANVIRQKQKKNPKKNVNLSCRFELITTYRDRQQADMVHIPHVDFQNG